MSDTSGSSRTRPSWLIPVAVVGVVILLIIVSIISSYNGMVHKRNGVDNAFAQVDVELQRQFDLIPNVVASVKGAQQQEQTVFDALAQARTQYKGATNADGKIAAANQLQTALGSLISIQENYPDLKSNALVQNLITELEGTQNRITQTRRDYNSTVTDYNNSIQSFPRNITAGIFGFDKKTLFVATAAAQTTPTVDFSTTTTSVAAAK